MIISNYTVLVAIPQPRLHSPAFCGKFQIGVSVENHRGVVKRAIGKAAIMGGRRNRCGEAFLKVKA